MYKLPACSYPKSQLKFWAGMIDYIEPVRDYLAYARYMIHDSPSAITEGKNIILLLMFKVLTNLSKIIRQKRNFT